MFRAILLIVVALVGCAPAPVVQPDWARTVAAYEILLQTDADKKKFVGILERHALDYGFHVDVATREELDNQSEVSPITFNAAVWRGEDDEESIASAMDFQDRIGRVWIAFSRGQDENNSIEFRKTVLQELKSTWPEARTLPIMPNGAIPLTHDLLREADRYIVKPSAASKYDEPPL